MIAVLATIQIAPGKRDEFLDHFRRLVPEVHAEQGCIEYGPMIDTPSGVDAQDELRPNVVVVVEQWESVDALKAHLVAPHMLAYREQVKDLVAGMQLQVLEPA